VAIQTKRIIAKPAPPRGIGFTSAGPRISFEIEIRAPLRSAQQQHAHELRAPPLCHNAAGTSRITATSFAKFAAPSPYWPLNRPTPPRRSAERIDTQPAVVRQRPLAAIGGQLCA
jgi:hypothetical protein